MSIQNSIKKNKKDKSDKIASIIVDIIIIIVIIILISVSFLFGYDRGKSSNSNQIELFLISDPDTDVMYYITSEGYICPRYCYDGSLYINSEYPEEENNEISGSTKMSTHQSYIINF